MWDWLLSAPKSSRATAALMVALACAAIVWVISWEGLASTLAIESWQKDPFSSLPCDKPGFILALLLVNQILLIPLLATEEVLRIGPLWTVMWFARRANNETFFQFATSFACILTAATFGVVHVAGLGVTLIHALLVQGVLGFLMNILYLKTGGMSDSPQDNLRGLWIAYLFHLLWDWVMFTPGILYYAYSVFLDPSVSACE